MEITLRVLTDDAPDFRLALKLQLTRLGYDPQVARDAEDLKYSILPGEKYHLVVDYLLSDGDSCSLLLELLDSGAVPSGLLIMSGLPNFEESVCGIADRYVEQNIPVFFLEKPFQQAELGELLHRLQNGCEGNFVESLILPRSDFVGCRELGRLLRVMRENLGLSHLDLVRAAVKIGYILTVEHLAAMEADLNGNEIGSHDWMNLTRLLYEGPDVYSLGFQPWIHLRRVRRALEEKTYRFPISLGLQRNLFELARRERLGQRFSDLSYYPDREDATSGPGREDQM